MTQFVIPVSAVPSQKINAVLGGQNCSFLLREMGGRQYLSLSIDGEQIFSSVLMVDRIPLKKYDYLPFVGDVASVDRQGTSDPDWQGWNTRFFLIYSDTAFKDD